MIDVAKNEPKIISHQSSKNSEKWHGVKIEMEVEGRYVERQQSVSEYLKQTAIANPYARIVYDGPNGKTVFSRAIKELPKQPKEIKPHPYGVELGILRRMMAVTRTRNIIGFLTNDFSRIGKNSAEQICRLAKIEPSRDPKKLTTEESERMHKAMQMVKLIAPSTSCLSPLNEKLILEGLKKEISAECYVAITRSPAVYRGYPFQVEVGIAYGGNLELNQTSQLLRFANKVPLLYNQSGCAIAQAVSEVDWRRYGLQQSSGSLPVGPLTILVHFASVWVPFTSEGKQAIAIYPEIIKEIKLALQDAGRKLAKYVRQKKKANDRQIRRQIFERYIPVVAKSLADLTDKKQEVIKTKLENMIKKKIEAKEVGKDEDKAWERKF
jgi:DNA topoisomerase-6 subunit B